MSDEIRVGDRFEITVEVTGPVDTSGRFPVHAFIHHNGLPIDAGRVMADIIHSGRRLPRQIKAGDRVTWGSLSGGRGTVVHVRGEWAVVDDGHYQGCPIDRPCTVELSRLTLDDKA